MTEITDLARRDEYLQASLKAAARLMWLIERAGDREDRLVVQPLEPPEEWLDSMADELRYHLDAGQLGWDVAYRVLQILGVTQAWISSSARVERANQTSIDVLGREV